LIPAFRLSLSKLVCARSKIRFSWLSKSGRTNLKLAILAAVLFGWSYVVVSKAIIALEFVQDPTAFVP
jgi:hypothetical protein